MNLIYAGICWFVGLWLAAQLPESWRYPWLWLSGAAILLGLSFASNNRSKNGATASLFAGIFLLAIFRYQINLPHIDPAHIAFYNESQRAVITGIVSGEPEIRDQNVRLELEAESIALPGNATRSVAGKIILFVEPYPAIPYGARVRASGQLNTPPEFDTFNYRAYLSRQGIFSVMGSPQTEILAEGLGSPIYEGILAIKGRAQDAINALIPEPAAALLSGILLGNEANIPADLQEEFRLTGMTHIIAISGFNISILAAILLRLFDPLAGKRLSPWLTMVGLALYTILVGADASVVRAAIMGGAYVLGNRILGRPNFNYGSLFLAGILMSLFNPYALWDVGFQLSFAATLGLMLYADRFSNWTRHRLARRFSSQAVNRVMGVINEGVLITLAAQLTTLPLMLYYFEQLSLISLIANPLILPVQPAIMLGGGLATLIGMAALNVARPLAWVIWLLLAYTINMVQFLAKIPFAAIPLRLNGLGLLLVYGLIFAGTYAAWQSPSRKAQIREKFAAKLPATAGVTFAGIAALLTLFWGVGQPDGLLHIHFLDVGQGDATFIQTPGGRQILIDGGISPTTLNNHVGRLLPFYDRDLDIVIATHPDADHVAGLPAVAHRFQIRHFINDGADNSASAEYDELLSALAEQRVVPHTARAGERIALGDGVTLHILHPAASAGTFDDNNNSVSLRLTYGDLALLLTGDAERPAEEEMLNSGLPLQAQIFKAGHHGSNSSSSSPFLAAVQPQFALISAGADNAYGHPHPDALQRLTRHGAAILRTDELGSVELVSDGKQMWWYAWD